MANTEGSIVDDVANALNRATFGLMLAFGASSAFFNSFQVHIAALPLMSGKYGRWAAEKEIGAAYRHFATALMKQEKDENGDVSILPFLQRKVKGYKKAVKEGKDVRGLTDYSVAETALRQAIKDGDISKSFVHDITNEADLTREDSLYSGYIHWGAKFMHHTERMNREITIVAAAMLAANHEDIHSNPPMNRPDAIAYARKINYDAHGDQSQENSAAFFKGAIGSVSTQFMKYTQLMYWNYAWNAYKAAVGIKHPRPTLERSLAESDAEYTARQEDADALVKKREDEAKIEAVRTFWMFVFAQTAAAGVYSLPLIGATLVAMDIAGSALVGVTGDDDEPWDTEKEIRLFLTKLIGKETTEMILSGSINALTPINAASRIDLSSMVFRKQLFEKEGDDSANQYLARIWGPSGAIVKNTIEAVELAKKGETQRAVEKMMPKFISDMLKAARYSDMPAVGEGGYRNKRGELVKKMSATEIGLQALGFTSSEINRTMTEMHYIKGEEHDLTAARSKIVGELAEATIAGEPLDYTAVREWNGRHPEFIIKPENVKQSVQSRKTQEKNRDGTSYTVNPKLSHLREKYELTY
jgi:hypothetical protein